MRLNASRGGDLVALGKRRIVECVLDEVGERPAEVEHGLPDVDKFGRTLADDVHAEKALRLHETIILRKPLESPIMWPRDVSRKRATPHS